MCRAGIMQRGAPARQVRAPAGQGRAAGGCIAMRVDTVWTNASLATMAGTADPLGVVADGMVAARDGRIVHVGPRGASSDINATETIDCGGRWITPGLVDCHTHLVYAGDRAREFEMGLAGASYEEIARA